MIIKRIQSRRFVYLHLLKRIQTKLSNSDKEYFQNHVVEDEKFLIQDMKFTIRHNYFSIYRKLQKSYLMTQMAILFQTQIFQAIFIYSDVLNIMNRI